MPPRRRCSSCWPRSDTSGTSCRSSRGCRRSGRSGRRGAGPPDTHRHLRRTALRQDTRRRRGKHLPRTCWSSGRKSSRGRNRPPARSSREGLRTSPCRRPRLCRSCAHTRRSARDPRTSPHTARCTPRACRSSSAYSYRRLRRLRFHRPSRRRLRPSRLLHHPRRRRRCCRHRSQACIAASARRPGTAGLVGHTAARLASQHTSGRSCNSPRRSTRSLEPRRTPSPSG